MSVYDLAISMHELPGEFIARHSNSDILSVFAYYAAKADKQSRDEAEAAKSRFAAMGLVK